MREFAAKEWDRAQRSLAAAEKLIATDPDSTASRAYYAAFHAVTAFFAAEGKSFKKHTAVRAAVHRDLVKTGFWNTELGVDYDYLMELREVGDYGGLQDVTEQDARMAVESATGILQAVKELLPSPPGDSQT